MQLKKFDDELVESNLILSDGRARLRPPGAPPGVGGEVKVAVGTNTRETVMGNS